LLLTNSHAQQLAKTDIKIKQESTELPHKIENLPLYLSIIEFYKPEKEAIEQAKQSLQNQKKIELHDKLTLNPFHQRKKSIIKEKMASQDGTFCLTCHLPLPHQKNSRTRTFNNMHSRYIACETCHLDKQKIADINNLDYLWFDYNHRVPIKNPQGLFKASNAQTIKITPFYQQQVAVITRHHLYVDTLNEQWKKANLTLKAEIKARIHQPLKSEGEECRQCHSKKDNILNVLSLGATEQELEAHQNNSIVSFFNRYSINNNQDEKMTTKNSLSNKEKDESIQRIRITELLN